METILNCINEARTKTTATVKLNRKQVRLILDALWEMDKKCNPVWVGRNWISNLYTNICDSTESIMDGDFIRYGHNHDIEYHRRMTGN